MNLTRSLVVAFALSLPSQVRADFFQPTRYDMPNGYGVASTGVFNYWDRFYSGTGNTTVDGAPLSGGLGDLSDGVVATGNWNVVENAAGTGPYVGWRLIDPLISFQFPSFVDFTTLSIHVDDANNAGGVRPPAQVVVNGLTFSAPDPAGNAPIWFDLDLSPLAATNQLDVRLVRRTEWTMASEFRFQGAAIPEPAAGGLLVSLIGFAVWRHRKG